ncbi:headcase protein-like, partial [Wyeomyia smithii]|uniref:headcase protein-like n=1 Tax=Wyeomyia smithii TaxID=174621 RepID=UPI0024682060
MAPRRGTVGPGTTGLDLFGALGDSDHGFESSQSADGSGSEGAHMTRCCVPTGDCLKSSPVDYGAINLEDLRDCVRVICNNENCSFGQYMHRECFDHWEESVLNYLKSIGRARSWSEKQRQQNLWTKKGYDLVFKACTCRCGRGHLRKDLDWIPPASLFSSTRLDEDSSKKKKKKNRQNQKPSLAISTSPGSHSSSSSNSPNSHGPNHQSPSPAALLNPLKLVDHFATSLLLNTAGVGGPLQQQQQQQHQQHPQQTMGRNRTNSLSSSSNGSSTPPASSVASTTSGAGSDCQSISPVHSGLGAGGPSVAATAAALAKMPLTPKTKVEIYSERV